MSLRRINKILTRIFRELIFNPRIKTLMKVQAVPKLGVNVLPKISAKAAKQTARPIQLGRALFRGFRNRPHQLLRPFASLHFHHSRLREFERSRGLLLLQVPQKKDVLERIRHLFGTNIRYNQALEVAEMPNTLDGYEIGDFIAKGCNGAVHAVKIKNVHDLQRSVGHGIYAKNKFKKHGLALKVMFNYNLEATEHVLWREMGTELVPFPSGCSLLQRGRMAKIRTLPSHHPNVIKMYTAFVDRMLSADKLPGADKFYPDAFPTISATDLLLFHEPKTLYVVMKRYRVTLHDYLKLKDDRRDQLLNNVLFGQLLEAVVYLHKNKICHRDMKSDNILLDYDMEDEIPHLVLSDFGSALATGDWIVKYSDDGVDLGGNLALRAPEIRRASPSPNTVVNFEMADTWAAGALAHEIYTGLNPFYYILSSARYSAPNVPPLPLSTNESIQRIVAEMLSVEPSGRPKPAVAANVVAMSLFRFDLRTFLRQQFGIEVMGSLVSTRQLVSSTLAKLNEQMGTKLGELTGLFAAETILSRLIGPSAISSAELQLRATFLSRADRNELRSALAYLNT